VRPYKEDKRTGFRTTGTKMIHVEKDTSGQVEAGPFLRTLFGQGRMARRAEVEPSDVDTDQPSERASDGGGVSEVLG
jgi:hypothetical protein